MRLVYFIVALVLITTAALAQTHMLIGGSATVGPTIIGVTVAGTTTPAYTSGASSVGAIAVAEVGATFSGTLAIGGAANFSLSSTSLPSNLNTTQTCSTTTQYTVTITPTQTGVINSGTPYSITVTCNPANALAEVGSGFTLVNNGSTASNVPVRFGYGYARGDMPLGNTVVCQDESAATYPCQIDQLSTRTGMPNATDTPGWLHSTVSLVYTPSWTAGASHTFHIYKQAGTYTPGTGLCPNTGGCTALTSIHDYQILYQNVKLFNGTSLGNFTCDLNKAITAGPIAGVGAGVDGGGGGYQIMENGSVETTIEALTPCENGSTPQGQIMAKFFVMLWNANPGGTPSLGQIEIVGWIGQPWQNCTTGVCAGGTYGGGIGFNWGDVSLYDATTSTTLRNLSHSSNFAPSDVLWDQGTWPNVTVDGRVNPLVHQFGGTCSTTNVVCPGGGYGTSLSVSGSTLTQSGGNGFGRSYYGSTWNNAYLSVGSGNANCNAGAYPITSAITSGSFTINTTNTAGVTLGSLCSSISSWQIGSGFINNYDNLQSGLAITFSVTNGTLPTPLAAGQLYFAGTGINVNQTDSSTSHNGFSPFSVWATGQPSEWGEHSCDQSCHWPDEVGVYNAGTCNAGGACFTVTRHVALYPWTGIYIMADDNSHPIYIAGSNPANTASLYPNLSNTQKAYWESTALIPPYYVTSTSLTAPSPTPIRYRNDNTDNNGGPYYEGEAVGPQETAIEAGGNHVGLGNMSGFAANWFLNSTQVNWDLVNNDALSASTAWLGSLLNAETGWITTYDCGLYPGCTAYPVLTKSGVAPNAHIGDYFLQQVNGDLITSGFTTPVQTGVPTFNGADTQKNFLGGVYYDNANRSDLMPTHFPDFSNPMAYIITGEPWILRQLQWWSNMVLAANSGRNNTINGTNYTGTIAFGGEEQRSNAWSLRSVMWGSMLGADSDPQRAYFWNLQRENTDYIYDVIHRYYGQNASGCTGCTADPNYETIGQWLTTNLFDDQFMHSYLGNVLQENYALTNYTSNVLIGASTLYSAEQASKLLVQYWYYMSQISDAAGHTYSPFYAGAEGFLTLQSISTTQNPYQNIPGLNPACPNAGCIGNFDGTVGYNPDHTVQVSSGYFYYAGNNYSQNWQGNIENGDMIWAGEGNDNGNALSVLGNTRYFVINVTPQGSPLGTSPPLFQMTTTSPTVQACAALTGPTGCPAAFTPPNYGSGNFSLAWRPQIQISSGLAGFGGGATGYAASTYGALQQGVVDSVPLAHIQDAVNVNQARNPLGSYYLSQNGDDGAQWQAWYMGPATVPFPPPAPQTISSITASPNPGSCVTGSVNPCTTVSATMSPTPPAFATDGGLLSLVASGGSCSGGDTADFSINATSGVISVSNTSMAAGSYTTCVKATTTASQVTNSPQYQSVPITVTAPPSQTISSITASPSTGSCQTGTAGVLCTTISAAMTPSTPNFASDGGTFSLVVSGGSCSGGDTTDFAINASTGAITLSNASAAVHTDTVCVKATTTASNVTNSPQYQSVSINVTANTTPTIKNHGVCTTYNSSSGVTSGSCTITVSATGDGVTFSPFTCNGPSCAGGTSIPQLTALTYTGGTCAEVPNTYTTGSSSTIGTDVWFCPNMQASGTVTLSFTAAGGGGGGGLEYPVFPWSDWSALALSSTAELGNQMSGIATANTPFTLSLGGSGSTSQTNELVYGVCVIQPATSQTLTAQQTQLDIGPVVNSGQGLHEYTIPSTIGASPMGCTTTGTGGRGYAISVAAFKHS